MKNVVRYGTVGMVIGTMVNFAIYFLGSIVECGWGFLNCYGECGDYDAVFGDFWSWNIVFAFFVFMSLGSWIIGALYGSLSEGDDKFKFNVVLAFEATLILVAAYLLTMFARGMCVPV